MPIFGLRRAVQPDYVSVMASEQIPVKAIHGEKTYVGKVQFPETTPEALVELFNFPDDLFKFAKKLDLSDHTMKFLMGALRGKWAITASLDLPDIAAKTGLSYSEMDHIVRDLVKKNFARMNDRLDLYRLWICLLHVKGVRFVEAEE